MRAIQVKKVVHRDRECQALIFDYNKEVVEQVKRIPGIRWSQTKRFWYTYDRGDLGKYLSAIVTTEKKHTQDVKIKSKATGTGISSENRVAINEVIRWMRQRQYSLTTCKQYHIEMKKFFEKL